MEIIADGKPGNSILTDTDKKLYKDLCGKVCVCGQEKKSMMSHCRNCYYSLPVDKRRLLYAKIGQGYAEVYAISVSALKAKGRVK